MTAKAYVLVRTVASTTDTIAEKLESIDGVQSPVELVTGPYDLIAIIETPTVDEVLSIVLDRIRPIEGVKDTLTCIAVQRKRVE